MVSLLATLLHLRKIVTKGSSDMSEKKSYFEGKTIYVNPAFEQTFGWSLDELREKRIDFVPEENWPETKETINRILILPCVP